MLASVIAAAGLGIFRVVEASGGGAVAPASSIDITRSRATRSPARTLIQTRRRPRSRSGAPVERSSFYVGVGPSPSSWVSGTSARSLPVKQQPVTVGVSRPAPVSRSPTGHAPTPRAPRFRAPGTRRSPTSRRCADLARASDLHLQVGPASQIIVRCPRTEIRAVIFCCIASRCPCVRARELVSRRAAGLRSALRRRLSPTRRWGRGAGVAPRPLFDATRGIAVPCMRANLSGSRAAGAAASQLGSSGALS